MAGITDWAPRELRTSFVSLPSASGAPARRGRRGFLMPALTTGTALMASHVRSTVRSAIQERNASQGRNVLEVPLVETTMDLVREVVIAGESWSAVDRAEELADAWRPVYVRCELSRASGGLLNVLATFEALAQEIARLSGHYDAGNWVTNAAADRWDDWDRPGPVLVDPNEEADETSPKAHTLRSFRRVVRTVSALTGPDWDPVRIRAQIFGQP